MLYSNNPNFTNKEIVNSLQSPSIEDLIYEPKQKMQNVQLNSQLNNNDLQSSMEMMDYYNDNQCNQLTPECQGYDGSQLNPQNSNQLYSTANFPSQCTPNSYQTQPQNELQFQTFYPNSQPTEDEYILNLHQRLIQTKQIRKLSEQRVDMLNNRLRCLKEENDKKLAKIDLLKKNQEKKSAVAERAKSRSKEKLERKERRERDVKKLKEKNYSSKLQLENNIALEKEKSLLRKQINAKLLKEEKQTNNYFRINNDLEENKDKKDKATYIRSQNITIDQRKKMQEIEGKERLIQNLEHKIQIELNKKDEIDEIINRLKVMEVNTIENIRIINEKQKMLIIKFDKILNEA